MISLEQALEDQKDLRQLIAPKTENRFEIFSPNNNYGFGYVMKKYAGYPLEEPIYATFPHGMYLHDRVVSKSELDAPLPAHLNFPPFSTPTWKKAAKKKKVIPFASPFHYALKLFQCETPVEERQGTLFLPLHSTRMVDVKFDTQAIIKELRDLPEEFLPVTVCIHWQDIEYGLDKIFRDAGFDIVCAGHLTDCNYLFRWLHLATRHKMVCHSGIGSALFYSIIADIPFWLTKENSTIHLKESFKPFNKDTPKFSKSSLQKQDKLREVFSEPTGVITEAQREIVSYFMHSELVKSPKGLLKQLNELKKMAGR